MWVCDLDQNALPDLSARLHRGTRGAPIARRAVVIPVREIEAWLLADHEAINTAFSNSAVSCKGDEVALVRRAWCEHERMDDGVYRTPYPAVRFGGP
jgi:hypothetical protein